MIEAIERGPVLHKEIQLRIRRYITEQQLQPGERLPSEETLCVQLGVGRSALREALKGLEAVGMIESRRGAGNYVAQFDPARYMDYFTSSSLMEALSVQELIEVRALLEVTWIKDAVARIEEIDVADLLDAWNRMQAKGAAGQSYRWEDFEIHKIVMRHVPNRLITAMLDAIFSLSEIHPAVIPNKDRQRSLDLAQHQMLVDAVIERDGDRAQQALILSYDKAASNYGFSIGWGDLARRPVAEQ